METKKVLIGLLLAVGFFSTHLKASQYVDDLSLKNQKNLTEILSRVVSEIEQDSGNSENTIIDS